jgi:hypothetical protein
MQFKAPTSSLKAITNNLTRAMNIYKSLVIIQRDGVWLAGFFGLDEVMAQVKG